MGFRETTWAFEQTLNDPIAKLVLVGLADYYNSEKGYAWPSVERLAAVADCSVRTVQRKLKDLEDKGYINRTHGHPYFNQNNTNVSSITIYRLNFEGGDTLSGGDKLGDGGDSSCREGGDSMSHPIDNERYNNKKMLKDAFDRWWREYPRKVSKLSAQKSYEKVLKKELASEEELLDGAKAYAVKVEGTDSTYISHPDTWLNKGRWADQEETVIQHTNFGVAKKWMPSSKEEFMKKCLTGSMKNYYSTHRPDIFQEAKHKGWI